LFHVLVTDNLGREGLDRLAKADDVSFELKTGLKRRELIDAVQECDALIIRSGTKVDRNVIDSGNRLRVIGRAGIGVDNVDVRAASQNGVLVMNAPEANTIATAEHTMALILAASRKVVSAHFSLKEGEWRKADFRGSQLYRKRLGIIGFGRIGRLVANRVHGFGMSIQAYDPYVSDEAFKEIGVEPVDLNQLLASSDIITLHASLTDETKRIINRQNIDEMKQGVILVNTARGGLIDESALAEAIQTGKVRAAAVDVYTVEPPADNPLVGLENVVHTPHLAASTEEAQRDVAIQIVDQVLDALRGIAFRNVINGEILESFELLDTKGL
jgi:D-3-phosphoglycerate dehydrogenase